ncbi:hypothetical protein KO498_10775 [Lentibacter algarum]|uniref:hypothetical protein n=1 Tax=Lentibacter algarum TaxID=576131 RepID=UPI001C0735BA|nr:hypothetical protein [Lentibacter algarum]MBU2982290.1 hypothetical protein [Lentibacter algarum]
MRIIEDLLRAFGVSLIMLAFVHAAITIAAVVCPPDISLQLLVVLPLIAVSSYFALPWLVCRPFEETKQFKPRVAVMGAVGFPLLSLGGLAMIMLGLFTPGEGLFLLFGVTFWGALMAVRYVRLRRLLP